MRSDGGTGAAEAGGGRTGIGFDEVFAVFDRSARLPVDWYAARMAADAAWGGRWSGVVLTDRGLAVAATGGAPRAIVMTEIVHGRRVAPGEGRFNELGWDPGHRELVVSADLLASRPLYVWESGSVVVLSSTLKAFRLLPFVPFALDREALAATLLLGHPLGTATLLGGVRTLPARTEVCFGRVHRIDRPLEGLSPPPDASGAGLNQPALLEALDDVLETATRSWVGGLSTAPVAALSGSVASRLLLGYLLRCGVEPAVVSWPPDTDGAAEVALAAGVAHEALAPRSSAPGVTGADLGAVGWLAEAFGSDELAVGWRARAQLLARHRRPVAHAFLADVVGEGHFAEALPAVVAAGGPARAVPALRTWAEGLAPRSLVDVTRSGFGRLLGPGLADAVTAEYDARPDPTAHQRLLWLDLLGSQRRGVGGGELRLLDVFGPVVLPFASRAAVTLALATPHAERADRRLARALLARRFPALAVPREPPRLAAGSRLTRAWRRLQRPGPEAVPLDASRALAPALRRASPILDGSLDAAALADRIEATGLPAGERPPLVRLGLVAAFLARYHALEDFQAHFDPLVGTPDP